VAISVPVGYEGGMGIDLGQHDTTFVEYLYLSSYYYHYFYWEVSLATFCVVLSDGVSIFFT